MDGHEISSCGKDSGSKQQIPEKDHDDDKILIPPRNGLVVNDAINFHAMLHPTIGAPTDFCFLDKPSSGGRLREPTQSQTAATIAAEQQSQKFPGLSLSRAADEASTFQGQGRLQVGKFCPSCRPAPAKGTEHNKPELSEGFRYGDLCNEQELRCMGENLPTDSTVQYGLDVEN